MADLIGLRNSTDAASRQIVMRRAIFLWSPASANAHDEREGTVRKVVHEVKQRAESMAATRID